jgi:cell division protease FtsH
MSEQKEPPNNPLMKSLFIWIGILVVIMLAVNMFASASRTAAQTSIGYSDFLTRLDDGQVREVQISGPNITGTMANDEAFKTYAPQDAQLVDRLSAKGVRFRATPEQENSVWMLLLYQSLPILVIFAIGFFILRQMQSSAGKGAMGFGKSRARLLTQKEGRVTFDDVAGIDEARDELQEIVDFLKDPTKFARLGGKIPKGALLVGSPGTGKTLLARAIAGEANVPFFTISGSDFVEMFVGVGASRVRDMFEQAKKNAPCIVFIDEIDAVGRHRGAGLGNGNDEREQTLNQLLVEMDGFEANEGIIIVAATNRPDVLDPALLRPGRFDRQVVVPRPDIDGREKILLVHMKKIPLAPDVSARVIARGTPGFSGADLANLVNEAALLAARFDRDQVTQVDFEMAKDKVMMGTERRSMVISESEKKTTAYHEAGHALVGMAMEPHSDPVHKVTIIPRGAALGLTQPLPKEDRYSTSREQAFALLAVLMGGRVAEQLIFGQTTTGASNDIKRASQIARRMVTEFGMSEAIGPVNYAGDDEGNPFLGRDFGMAKRDYSEKVAVQIDEEVRQIIVQAEAKAREILTQKREILEATAAALLDRETIDAADLLALWEGRPLAQRERLVFPTWSEKERVSKEKRRGSSIFGPPKPVAG